MSNKLDTDYAAFYLTPDEHMQKIMLTVESTRPMSAKEYVQALICFIEEIDDPEKIFDEHYEYADTYM